MLGSVVRRGIAAVHVSHDRLAVLVLERKTLSGIHSRWILLDNSDLLARARRILQADDVCRRVNEIHVARISIANPVEILWVHRKARDDLVGKRERKIQHEKQELHIPVRHHLNLVNEHVDDQASHGNNVRPPEEHVSPVVLKRAAAALDVFLASAIVLDVRPRLLILLIALILLLKERQLPLLL